MGWAGSLLILVAVWRLGGGCWDGWALQGAGSLLWMAEALHMGRADLFCLNGLFAALSLWNLVSWRPNRPP